jgi:4-hydroxy-tetrahydrodipicolinate synthase
MRVKSAIKGVITALATPFKNGEVDKKSFVKLVQHQLGQGIDGFVVNGTTGESPTLTHNEVRELYDIARGEGGGKVTVTVGTGNNSTAKTCEFTKEVAAWKPDAVLVVVPYYNRPPQRGLVQHFTAVAECSNAPVIVYNVPSRTSAALQPETIATLSRHQHIVGIKEATGDLELLEEMRGSVEAGFVLLSGDDMSSVDFCTRGGHGVISVSSHVIGKEMKEHIAAKSVSEYAKEYSDFMKHLYIEANPIPVKAALHWMGLFESMEMRLPLVALDSKFHKDYRSCLQSLGKI